MDIFEGQEKLDRANKIAKPKRGCKKCSGKGSFVFQPSIAVRGGISFFGPGTPVLCSCVKVKNAR